MKQMSREVKKPTQQDAASSMCSQKADISYYRISAMCSFSFQTICSPSYAEEHWKMHCKSWVCT